MRLLPSLERTIIPDTFTRIHQKPFPARYIQARFFELIKIIITIRKIEGNYLYVPHFFCVPQGFIMREITEKCSGKEVQNPTI